MPKTPVKSTKKSTKKKSTKATKKTRKSTKTAPKKSATSVKMTQSDKAIAARVDSLADVLNDRGLSRVEVETESLRIVVERSLSDQLFDRSGPAVIASAGAAPQLPATAAASAAQAVADTTETVDSPFVGTFYRSPNPESPAYVSPGQVVEPGQSLCIIEAMKLMNEIEAEARLRIVEVLVENESPVEYGQALFRVERA